MTSDNTYEKLFAGASRIPVVATDESMAMEQSMSSGQSGGNNNQRQMTDCFNSDRHHNGHPEPQPFLPSCKNLSPLKSALKTGCRDAKKG